MCDSDACLEATRSTFTLAWKDIEDVDSSSLATCSKAFDHDQPMSHIGRKHQLYLDSNVSFSSNQDKGN